MSAIHLDDLVCLVLVSKPREKPMPMRRRSHDQLRKNAPRAPYVNRFVVLPRAQQHLGRAIPPRHNVLRHHAAALSPGSPEIADADIAVFANKAASEKAFSRKAASVGRTMHNTNTRRQLPSALTCLTASGLCESHRLRAGI